MPIDTLWWLGGSVFWFVCRTTEPDGLGVVHKYDCGGTETCRRGKLCAVESLFLPGIMYIADLAGECDLKKYIVTHGGMAN